MESEKKEEKKLTWDIIVMSVLFIIIPLTFFYILSRQTGNSFGLGEIFFSLFISAFIILILIWIKKTIMKNAYLGISIGLLVLIASVYSLYLRFKGTYTNAFAAISGLLAIAFLLYNFFKYKSS